MKKGVFLFVVLVCFSALFAQTTIVSEGFNNSVTLFTSTGGVYKTGNSTSSDAPASSPFAIEGTHSIGVNNGTLTLTSNTINTTGYTGIELVFRLASFSISSAGNGADATIDIVKVEISTNDGTNWTEILQVKGNSNAYWSYSGGTGIASVDYSNFTTSQTFQPSAGGARTADGYSTVKITNLPATNQLKVRITAVNNHKNELWVIDDFKITGTAAATGTTTFVVGNGTEPDTISSLINAESQAVFVFDFTVTDDGSTPTTDNNPTKITSIKIFQGANNQITDWTKAIAGAQLIDNETNIVNGTIETDKISFTLNTATSGKVNDNATKTYELYVWLKSDMTTLKSNIDNKQFDFKISNSSFTVDTTGSGFASGQADITSGANKNKVNVVATKLNIENISNVTVNSPFSANVEATDANGNRDLDNTASVTLSKASGSGNLTSSNNLTQSLVNGYKTFTNLFYDVAGTFSIQADATGLTSATSNNITASISSSNPAVLVENFTATGNLKGYNSWTRYSGTADSIQITSGALTYSNYPNSGVGNKITINGSNSEDVYKSFTAITSQYVYYSFLIKVTPSNSSGTYFMFLDPDGNLANAGDWCARLFAKSDGTNIQFGISNSSTASWASTNYNNTTHCIVVKLDRNTGNLALFVDPDLSNSTEPTPTFTVNGSGAIGNVSSIAIRQAKGLPAIQISNLRVANSWSQAPLPVELSLFTYKLVDGKVKLVWNTATELNNKGFYVEKNTGNSWITLGFVDGKGNSNISNSYEFTDNSQNFGKVSYRLKQVDFDGKFTYSHTIEVNATLPKELTLMQNYPNPFNPTTTITYAIPTAGNVSVKVYNSLGQEVVTLFEGYQEAGMKQLNFNANNLNSGIYYCVVNFGNSTKVTKMMLMK